MAITVSAFDCLKDGQTIEKVTLTNQNGTAVSVLTLGATIQSFVYDGKDIVLGFDRAADYFESGAYIGATVGRVCNRTADGCFSLNGTTYQLNCNEVDRRVHLHGGAVGRVDMHLKGNIERLQGVGGLFDDGQVAVTTHNDAYFFHNGYLRKNIKGRSYLARENCAQTVGKKSRFFGPLWCSTIIRQSRKTHSFDHQIIPYYRV